MTDPKIVTTHVYPPIPIRSFDWSAVLDGYEPGCPIGWGATEEAAIADLRELLADEREAEALTGPAAPGSSSAERSAEAPSQEDGGSAGPGAVTPDDIGGPKP